MHLVALEMHLKSCPTSSGSSTTPCRPAAAVYASATEGTGLIKVPTASKTIPRIPFQVGCGFIGVLQSVTECARPIPSDARSTTESEKIRKIPDWAVCTDIMGREAGEGIRVAGSFGDR